ncbi:hypothetical protein O3M35_012073 [Rhynocoris fuscipes]|uniref:Uncharacterized protein n=1 Tax=Rhynocoris fuscipes TaxID=488301 RepID=A0AAW1CSR9_9HEMI
MIDLLTDSTGVKMGKNKFSFIWAMVLFSLVQDSLCALGADSWQQAPSNYNFNQLGGNGEVSNELVNALEDIYKQNSAKIQNLEQTIKRWVIDLIQNFELDPEMVKDVIKITDQVLSSTKNRVGELWRKLKTLITSGLAARLLKDIDLDEVINYIIEKTQIIENIITTLAN